MTFTGDDAGRTAATSICPVMRKEPSAVMSTVAHFYPFVIGVDTHARTHTYAVLAANGAHLGTEAFPNTHAGRTRAIAWASRRTGGDLEALWAIEGTGMRGPAHRHCRTGQLPRGGSTQSQGLRISTSRGREVRSVGRCRDRRISPRARTIPAAQSPAG